MSGENWTPGQWRAGSSEFYPGLDGPLTKRVYTDDPLNEIEVAGDNCRANAHLIAAAPELYEALKAARFMLVATGYHAVDGIDAALAKARGEA